ncbi:hypothetical protein [Catellatospora methionotrophica]|uniref:hypothetical protein n=1 Tax=Catellatospora methionotrophica TaxID=121620 RepID=UPI00340B168B
MSNRSLAATEFIGDAGLMQPEPPRRDWTVPIAVGVVVRSNAKIAVSGQNLRWDPMF